MQSILYTNNPQTIQNIPNTEHKKYKNTGTTSNTKYKIHIIHYNNILYRRNTIITQIQQKTNATIILNIQHKIIRNTEY